MPQQTPYARLSRRVRALPGLLSDAPGWLLLLVGIATTGLGLLLAVRPLSSLTVLGVYIGISLLVSGIGELAARREHADRTALLVGTGWLLAGVAVLAWLGRSLELLGPSLAVLLILTGAAKLLRLLRERTGDAALAGAFGLSEIAFGVVALSWPDATLLVVAVLFGARTVGFGLSLVWRGAVRRERGRSRLSARRLAPLRWAAAVVVLVLAGSTLYVSAQFRQGIPVLDGFYDAPSVVPAEPGQLLRAEPYDGADLPEGLVAQRILYTTTADEGVPGLASAVVAVPESRPDTPMPLIAWAHGTVGIARACAPSLGEAAIATEGMPSMDALVRNGWAMVATDYIGQGTEGDFPYLIGQGEGRSVLDAVRAAHQLDGLDFGQTVIWGHSQGGHAALWAGQLAPTYAPDLDVAGIAALSAASDPPGLAEVVTANPGVLGASLGISFVAAAYSRTYDDVSFDDINPAARTLVREAAARCTSEPGTIVTILTGVAVSKDTPILARDPSQGPLGERLRENVAPGPWPAPLLLTHGTADEVIVVRLQDAYVDRLCAAGRPLQYVRYEGRTHMGVLEPDSPLNADLEQWTKDRLAGRPQADGCQESTTPAAPTR